MRENGGLQSVCKPSGIEKWKCVSAADPNRETTEMSRIRSLGLFALLAVVATPVIPAGQPYAGQEARDIAALSESDVDDLLAGRGWGFAKPAELNGYPGPTHLLELAGPLGLDDGQLSRIEAIRLDMSREAQALGADYVAAEAALDTAFARGALADDELADLVAEAERLRSELRRVHLAAHLKVKPLLTRHQIAMYNDLRGYGGGVRSHGGHGHE